MVCVCCHGPTRGWICDQCLGSMRTAPERILPGGLRVVAPFTHEGAARRLMHLLKYRGVDVYAGLVADLLAERLPSLPLVPIPRAISRRVRYGVDPANVLANAIARRTGAPVIPALKAHWHSARRAGGDHQRSVAVWRVRPLPSSEVIVVDDVVTTGTTLLSAVAALGWDRVAMGAAANTVSGVTDRGTTLPLS